MQNFQENRIPNALSEETSTVHATPVAKKEWAAPEILMIPVSEGTEFGPGTGDDGSACAS